MHQKRDIQKQQMMPSEQIGNIHKAYPQDKVVAKWPRVLLSLEEDCACLEH